MKKFLVLTLVLTLVLCTFVSASAKTFGTQVNGQTQQEYTVPGGDNSASADAPAAKGPSFQAQWVDPQGGIHTGDYIDGQSQGANGEYGQAKNYDGTPGDFTTTIPDVPAPTPKPVKNSSMPKTGDTTMAAELLLVLSVGCFVGSRIARKQRIGK